MGVAGIGSLLSSLGTQYDFTKMSNAQMLAAANELESEGKISATDASQLSWIAQGVDSVPINGNGPTVAETLADPTQKNWIAYMQESSDWQHSTPGNKGVEITDSILNDLRTYQGSSTEEMSKTISTMA